MWSLKDSSTWFKYFSQYIHEHFPQHYISPFYNHSIPYIKFGFLQRQTCSLAVIWGKVRKHKGHKLKYSRWNKIPTECSHRKSNNQRLKWSIKIFVINSCKVKHGLLKPIPENYRSYMLDHTYFGMIFLHSQVN